MLIVLLLCCRAAQYTYVTWVSQSTQERTSYLLNTCTYYLERTNQIMTYHNATHALITMYSDAACTVPVANGSFFYHFHLGFPEVRTEPFDPAPYNSWSSPIGTCPKSKLPSMDYYWFFYDCFTCDGFDCRHEVLTINYARAIYLVQYSSRGLNCTADGGKIIKRVMVRPCG